MSLIMDTLERIRNKIDEQREEAHTDLREAGDEEAPTSSYDEWLIAAAEDGFEPSPEEQSDPDVLVVTGDGIKER